MRVHIGLALRLSFFLIAVFPPHSAERRHDFIDVLPGFFPSVKTKSASFERTVPDLRLLTGSLNLQSRPPRSVTLGSLYSARSRSRVVGYQKIDDISLRFSDVSTEFSSG